MENKIINRVLIFILICAITLCTGFLGFGNKYENMVDEAKKLAEKGNVEQAVPLLYEACEKGKVEEACGYIAGFVKIGALDLPNFDPYKVLNSLLQSPNEKAQWVGAVLLEYVFYDTPDSLNMAYGIYNKLQNTKDAEIKEDIDGALRRAPTYVFLSELAPITAAYKQKKIRFDQYKALLNNLNTNNLTPDMRESFYAFKNSCLADAKQTDNFLLNYAGTLGKIFMSGLAGGPLGLAGIAPEVIGEAKNFLNVNKNCKDDTLRFYNILEREGINSYWQNAF